MSAVSLLAALLPFPPTPTAFVRPGGVRALTPLLLLLAALLTGCEFNRDLRLAQQQFCAGQTPAALAIADEYVRAHGRDHNAVIAWLEKGNLERCFGRARESNESFAQAEAYIDRLDAQADISLSREALAAVTNLNVLPYRGTTYDRIMLNVYRAGNFLALGDTAAARVELNRAYQRQREAVQANAQQIEQAQQALRQTQFNQVNYDLQRTYDSAALSHARQTALGSSSLQPYGDYVNPFAELFQGLFFLHQAQDGSDLERGVFFLQRAAALAPGNRQLAEEARAAQARQQGGAGDAAPPVYVIFETGCAPARDQFRLDLPLFLVTNQVDYVGIALPKLVYHRNSAGPLSITGDGRTVRTEVVADMDRIVAREFEQEYPAIVVRTLVASASKAAIAHVLRETAERSWDRDHRQNDWPSLLVRMAAGAYQVSMNEADRRTWATLPKEIHYARLPRPRDGRLQLQLAGRMAGGFEVQLQPFAVGGVWVRDLGPGRPLEIWQFRLR